MFFSTFNSGEAFWVSRNDEGSVKLPKISGSLGHPSIHIHSWFFPKSQVPSHLLKTIPTNSLEFPTTSQSQSHGFWDFPLQIGCPNDSQSVALPASLHPSNWDHPKHHESLTTKSGRWFSRWKITRKKLALFHWLLEMIATVTIVHINIVLINMMESMWDRSYTTCGVELCIRCFTEIESEQCWMYSECIHYLLACMVETWNIKKDKMG